MSDCILPVVNVGKQVVRSVAAGSATGQQDSTQDGNAVELVMKNGMRSVILLSKLSTLGSYHLACAYTGSTYHFVHASTTTYEDKVYVTAETWSGNTVAVNGVVQTINILKVKEADYT